MKKTVEEVRTMVRAYYEKPGNEAGGNLHLVLDDGNLDDRSVKFCLKAAQTEGDVDGIEIATAMLALSKTQRRKITRA